MNYAEFLERKAQLGTFDGFEPIWMPDFLYDFQVALVDWATRKGRAAIFADCGLGKTPMQLVWAQNVIEHTNQPVLIATPLAVGYQHLMEAEKFGIKAVRSQDGRMPEKPCIVITNYERLERFDASRFSGMVCDESSILKSFTGATRGRITEFMRRLRFRLLCTATAAPNDYTELGTSSEALGYLGTMDMLERFFKNDDNKSPTTQGYFRGRFLRTDVGKSWRFKGHAEIPFWQWVCSWSRAIRKPSDLNGFKDDGFALPALEERLHLVEAHCPRPGLLFEMPAVGLYEQRQERKHTIRERCERVASLVDDGEQAMVWCHLNAEGKRLAQDIPGALEVAGSDSIEKKEERLLAFANGELRVLVTKPKIGAWGLNLQRCAHVTFFPSHSYEQYYQAIRRCWRFGQKRPVHIDVITTEGESTVLANLKRKAKNADRMFSALVNEMNSALHLERNREEFPLALEVPPWL